MVPGLSTNPRPCLEKGAGQRALAVSTQTQTDQTRQFRQSARPAESSNRDYEIARIDVLRGDACDLPSAWGAVASTETGAAALPAADATGQLAP